MQRPTTGRRRILHVDMDAFFAAIEQRDCPAYRGKPVIIGSLPGSRGVVSTASYEARRFGVGSAMPISEAYRRCPQGIYLRPNGKKYTHVARQALEIFQRFSPQVEPVSIDEAYLDISGSGRLYPTEAALAAAVKTAIRDELQLACSIGIADNRPFAKIATNLEKPDGLTILLEADIPARVYPLPVQSIGGIGDQTAQRLGRFGIRTIGQLAGYPVERLRAHLGSQAESLSAIAQGRGRDHVHETGHAQDEKSVGHEHTFNEDITDWELVEATLLRLCEKTGRRLRKRQRAGKTVVIKLRYGDFQTITRRTTLPHYVCEDMAIFDAARALCRAIVRKRRTIRLIGVTVTGLGADLGTSAMVQQMDLFQTSRPSDTLNDSIDRLKNQFGDGIINHATVLTTHSRI